MIVETIYPQTTPDLPLLCDRVVNDREIIYIKSQSGENVAFVLSWMADDEL